MPNGQYDSDINAEELKAENARLRVELTQVRAEAQAMLQQCAHLMDELRTDAAKVVHALDAAVQTVDALIAWMPEGLALSPDVAACKQRLDMAIAAITGAPRK